MKNIIIFVSLLFLVSCASTEHVRVKNCKAIGSDLYDCEVLSDHSNVRNR